MVGESTFLALSERIHWRRVRIKKSTWETKPITSTIIAPYCIVNTSTDSLNAFLPPQKRYTLLCIHEQRLEIHTQWFCFPDDFRSRSWLICALYLAVSYTHLTLPTKRIV